MELMLYVDGPYFQERVDLKSLLDLMNNYEITYNNCLKKSADFYDVAFTQYPKLKLISLAPGSVDIRLVVETASALAPLAPELFGYSWKLYKSGYDLLSMVTRYFRKERKPPVLHINDSPGAIINIVNGDQISVPHDAYNMASTNHQQFHQIASLIKNKFAEKIRIRPTQPELGDQLEFDESNQDDFYLPKIDITERESIELECSIYRFNKKSLNGSLEFDDQGEILIRPFVVTEDMIDDCIEALKAPSAKIIAYKELEKNALGESKIKRFHIEAITPIKK